MDESGADLPGARYPIYMMWALRPAPGRANVAGWASTVDPDVDFVIVYEMVLMSVLK